VSGLTFIIDFGGISVLGGQPPCFRSLFHVHCSHHLCFCRILMSGGSLFVTSGDGVCSRYSSSLLPEVWYDRVSVILATVKRIHVSSNGGSRNLDSIHHIPNSTGVHHHHSHWFVSYDPAKC
jgi:hypothetical protein